MMNVIISNPWYGRVVYIILGYVNNYGKNRYLQYKKFGMQLYLIHIINRLTIQILASVSFMTLTYISRSIREQTREKFSGIQGEVLVQSLVFLHILYIAQNRENEPE